MGRSVMQEAVTLEEEAASSYWTEAEARVVLEAYEASGLYPLGEAVRTEGALYGTLWRPPPCSSGSRLGWAGRSAAPRCAQASVSRDAAAVLPSGGLFGLVARRELTAPSQSEPFASPRARGGLLAVTERAG
jgi:hypothetical protein